MTSEGSEDGEVWEQDELTTWGKKQLFYLELCQVRKQRLAIITAFT